MSNLGSVGDYLPFIKIFKNKAKKTPLDKYDDIPREMRT